MVKVVEFYAPPSSGKSVLAAGCYYELSAQGRAVTLLAEYIKTAAERGQYRPSPVDQPFIYGNQSQLEVNAVMADYEYVFCESSSLLCAWYAHHYSNGKMPKFTESVLEWEDLQAETFNLQRTRVFIELPADVYKSRYHEEGRYETFAQALNMQQLMKTWLLDLDPNTIVVQNSEPKNILKILGA